MIDLDVMSNGTTTTILHWLQSDFILSPERVLTPGPTNSSLGPPYFGPAPPPGNPHRYTFLLFSQPEDFTIPESFSNLNPPTGITDLFGFNITSFVAATGLDDPLAGNYFRVVNTTGTPTGTPSGTASGTGTPAQTSPAQFEGGSTALKVFSGRDVGLSILFVAVAAGFWAL